MREAITPTSSDYKLCLCSFVLCRCEQLLYELLPPRVADKLIHKVIGRLVEWLVG